MKFQKRHLNSYLLWLSLTTELLLLFWLKTPVKAATPTLETPPATAAPLLADAAPTNLSPPSTPPTSENNPANQPAPIAPAPIAPAPTTSSDLPLQPAPISPLPSASPTLSPPTPIPPAPPTPIPPTPPTPSPPTPSSPLSPGEIRVLLPAPQAILDVPAATVVLQYTQGSQVELKVNGSPVPDSLVGRTETDKTTGIVTQTWYGVSLKEGENTLTAQTQTNGVAGALASVQVQVRGDVQQLTVNTVETRIPADGRSTATVQGQLLDGKGNRSNRDAIVTLVASEGEFVGADASSDQPGFQVKAIEGQFTAALRSSLNARTVNIRAVAGSLEAFTQLLFETNLRPSIATGVIDIRFGKRGTNFYDSFRDFLPDDRNNRYEFDVRGAVFATGKIGEWLFTGAYNSNRALNQTCDGTTRLFRDTQSCDQTYPTYGDNSQSTVLTPSTDSLYLRLERTSPIPGAGIDYAMWGDYNTEEFARRSQEFTAITRQLHGLKVNHNFGNLQLTGFYGNNVQGFQRDTIAPDGTSGYYFLSRRLLVEGSENVFLELEDLNRPGTVLDRKSLSRGPDYEIDYDRGALLFRQPILRTDVGSDGETLVRRIIVTYQYDTPGSNNSIYAGRAVYHLSREQNRESWIGATYLKEDQGTRDFELYGADAYISLGSTARLIAEYAHSHNVSDTLGPVSGSAYRAELEGKIAEGILGRAYYRSAETGFANNATVSFVPGQTRYGAQVSAKLSPITALRFQYDHEDNKGIAPRPLVTLEDLLTPRLEAVPGSRVDNSLTTLSAGVVQKFGSAELAVDWFHRDRSDRINPTFNTTSDQLRSRLTVPLTPTLTFLAQNETTLSAQTDAVYSDRTLMALNWQAMPGINVQLAQQFYTRGQFAGQAITSLGVAGDYKLGADTTLSGRLSLLRGSELMTMYGTVGINHRIVLAPGLKMDLAYEHVFGDFLGKKATGTQFLQPFAPGQSAASVGLQSGDTYSVGISYTDNPNFQASARFEHRTSSEGSNTVISAAATGKISPSLTALFRYQQANAANQKLSGLGDTATLKLGLAYRDPNNDKFNALLRYEYRKNPSIIPDTILFGSGTGSIDHVFAAEAIYAPNWRWEFYGKFAIRSSTSYLASDFVNTGLVTLAQARATYRLGFKWDVVAEARWINQPGVGYSETGFVAEVGYYLTPNLRLSAGYMFGRVGDRDFDGGSRSSGGPYVGVTIKLNELFNGFGQQRIPPPQNPPSQPVATASQEPIQSSEFKIQSSQPSSPETQIATTPEIPIQNSDPSPPSPSPSSPLLPSPPPSLPTPEIPFPGTIPSSASFLNQ
ncbi:TonB-dependent receptor (plasmid) [Kovacikia minuta CCNUW1]|uniref:TonB-dependent receptor n=1 Tax=Kovacikia minuta TaxID=2931930 RepID=UPI001CCF9B75|nr:TonB-dependent receptor [Kovacikia minuta]UBF29978.1 TonB-dependent receptor [Kovacikia minuta CCNUW1]